MGIVDPSSTLRQSLRQATAHAHDQLDSTMRAVAGWSSLADYTRFLSLQHAARAPVEAWLAAHAPSDLHPPPQTPLIAQDLAQLDHALPHRDVRFSLSRDTTTNSERASALGVAWVLAGSSLGNRAILSEIRRAAQAKGWPDWPAAFLGDEAMLSFWKRLRIELENSTDMEVVEVASRSAASVFDHFIAHAQSSQGSKSPPISRGELEEEKAQGKAP